MVTAAASVLATVVAVLNVNVDIAIHVDVLVHVDVPVYVGVLIVVSVDAAVCAAAHVDAVRKLRESGSTATFVFVTVHSEEEFVEACMEAGALGYVRKSCLNHDLVPAIKAALAGQPFTF
jgi:DNA-binding NarL/FixJ family response regulator